MNMKNKFIPALAILLSLGFIISCDKNEAHLPATEPFSRPMIKLINAIPNVTSPVDFYMNNRKLTGATVTYGSSFPTNGFYLAETGFVNLRAVANGIDVFNGNLTTSPFAYYTVFVIDTFPRTELYSILDAGPLYPNTDSGKALIRFVHVAKGVGALKLVNVTNAAALDTVAKNVTYKTNTGLIQVNSGTNLKYQLYLTGTSTTVGAALTLTLNSSRTYILYARGRQGATGTGAPGLSSSLIQ